MLPGAKQRVLTSRLWGTLSACSQSASENGPDSALSALKETGCCWLVSVLAIDRTGRLFLWGSTRSVYWYLCAFQDDKNASRFSLIAFTLFMFEERCLRKTTKEAPNPGHVPLSKMTFLSKEAPSVPCRNRTDFRKGLIQIKMCLYKKNYFLQRKHIVWGKFIVLARSLISGCQKVLVWTKICCNKNALFWRNLLAPWKPIQFRKICWFQWKIYLF